MKEAAETYMRCVFSPVHGARADVNITVDLVTLGFKYHTRRRILSKTINLMNPFASIKARRHVTLTQASLLQLARQILAQLVKYCR